MKKLLIIPMLFACYMGMCQASVIGKPIRLQKFEVAQYNFIEAMTWENAKAECAKLGKGWRLPTKDELNVMYKNNDRINMEEYIYWSSTEYDGYDAWKQNFSNGRQNPNIFKNSKGYVRAVRAY